MLRTLSSTAPGIRSQVNRSAYVRTWTFVESPADAFALIRGIEQKYGPIAEYRFARDCELNTAYQLVVHLTFVNESSFYKIPTEADVLHIPAPPTRRQPGGIGLADILDLLPRRSASATPLDAPIPKFGSVMQNVLTDPTPDASRTIDCRIQRSVSGFSTPPAYPPGGPPRRIRDAIARNFINWGGFHTFPPIPRDTPLPNDLLFPSSPSPSAAREKGDTGALEHVRMRRALRRASEFLEMPNPYELAPATAADTGGMTAVSSAAHTTTAAADEIKEPRVVAPLPETVWEPLPGALEMEMGTRVDLDVSVPLQPLNAMLVEEEETTISSEVHMVGEAVSKPMATSNAQASTHPDSTPGSQPKQTAQLNQKQKQQKKQKQKQKKSKAALTRTAQHTNAIPANTNTAAASATPTPTPVADPAPTPDPALAIRDRLKSFAGGWF